MKLTKNQIEIYARWWNELNEWKWPEDFPFGKPKDFDELENYSHNKSERTKYQVIDFHVRNLASLIGHKECLRWHWLHNLDRTNRQFEIWWFRKKVTEFIQFLGFQNFYWY